MKGAVRAGARPMHHRLRGASSAEAQVSLAGGGMRQSGTSPAPPEGLPAPSWQRRTCAVHDAWG